MRRLALVAYVLASAGCPKERAASTSPDLARSLNPYHDVTPQKMKEAVEAAQKREQDRDDKKLEEAKQ